MIFIIPTKIYDEKCICVSVVCRLFPSNDDFPKRGIFTQYDISAKLIVFLYFVVHTDCF